jgi:hypothetical protein
VIRAQAGARPREICENGVGVGTCGGGFSGVNRATRQRIPDIVVVVVVNERTEEKERPLIRTFMSPGRRPLTSNSFEYSSLIQMLIKFGSEKEKSIGTLFGKQSGRMTNANGYFKGVGTCCTMKIGATVQLLRLPEPINSLRGN